MRVSAPAPTVKDLWDALTASFTTVGSGGKLLADNLDAKVSLAKADLTTLEARLSAARATKLDNLDNINASFLNLWYEAFFLKVDDLPSVAASGDVANPNQAIDNNVTTLFVFSAVDRYLQIDFAQFVYIKKFRYYGYGASDPGNRYKIQAFVNEAWTDVLTGIVDIAADEWSAWLDLATPSRARLWRLVNTTYAVFGRLTQVEFMGVKAEG